MLFSGVIFDLDGVIADTESVQLRAVNLMLEPYGHALSPAQWAREYVGHPIEEDIRDIRTRFRIDAPLPELSAYRRQAYSKLLGDSAGLEPLPGLERLLDELAARRIPLGIASGSPRADVETVLRTLNLMERFSALATADEVKQTKPAPDVYLLAAARLNLNPTDCVAIEDSATGMAAAKSAGLHVIGVPSLYTRHHDLSRADKLAGGFDEVFDLLIRQMNIRQEINGRG